MSATPSFPGPSGPAGPSGPLSPQASGPTAQHASVDWDAVLRERLPLQTHAVESHIVDGTRVWLKRCLLYTSPSPRD